MTVSDYVQWHLKKDEMSTVSAPFLDYVNSSKQSINAARLDAYSNIIKKKFNSNEKNIENYFNLIANITGNKNFQSALNTAVDKLNFPSFTNRQLQYSSAIQDLLKKDANTYQKLVNEINSVLQNIMLTLGTMDLDAALSPEANKAINKIFQDNSTNRNKIVTIDQYKQLDNTAIGQYKYLLSLIPDFQEISKLPAGTDASVHILSKILVPVQTLIGFASEFQTEYEIDKILNSLEKDLGAIGNISVKRTGGEQTSVGGYKFDTSDLSIHLGESAGIDMSCPDLGLSLKRSTKNLNTAQDIRIKLKGSTYGKLLKDVDPAIQTAFYTIYAYTDPYDEGDVSKDVLKGAYKRMKMEATISALIGNVDAEQLTFVLVVNNKTITIFDLLKNLADGKNDPFSLSPAFENVRSKLVQQHKGYYVKNPLKKHERSDKLRSYISNKMSAQVYLKLTQANLKSFT